MPDFSNAPWLNTPNLGGTRLPKVDPDRMREWLLEHGFKPHPSRRDEYITSECPECGSGKAWRVMVSIRTGMLNCHGCGHGRRNVYRWTAEWDGVTMTETLEALSSERAPNVDDLWREVKEEIKHEQHGLKIVAPDVGRVHWLDQSGSLPESWMADALTATMKRGFSFEWLLSKSIGFGRSGRYVNRVIIPVFFNQQFVWLQAWDWTKTSDIKYHSPTRVDGVLGRAQILYQWDGYCKSDVIVVAEGVFNAWSAELAGYPTTASFGKGMSVEQFSLLLDAPARAVIFAYDNDALARATALALDLVRFQKQAWIVKYADDQDLNDHLEVSGVDAVRGILSAARPPDPFDLTSVRKVVQPLLGPSPKNTIGKQRF